MNPDLHDFIKTYGKSWKDFFDITFLKILSIVFFFTIIIFFYLSTKEYSPFSESFENILQQKYIEIIKRSKEVRVDFPKIKKDEIAKSISTSSKIIIKESGSQINLDDLIGDQTIFDTHRNKMDLPDLSVDQIEINDVLIAVKDHSRHGGMLKKIPTNPKNNIILDENFNAWDFNLGRMGNVYFEPMREKKEKIKGWRDSDEISLAMQNRERMVEYCYRREAKNYSVLHGYVLVRFIILHTGIVDPASVQISKSTIYNKRIELCIKNTLKRYRGFESLDESMGSVSVVQKFIFN